MTNLLAYQESKYYDKMLFSELPFWYFTNEEGFLSH